jgi:hypothetical protein
MCSAAKRPTIKEKKSKKQIPETKLNIRPEPHSLTAKEYVTVKIEQRKTVATEHGEPTAWLFFLPFQS